MQHESDADRLKTSVLVDLRALDANYRALERLLRPHASMLCVVKADAYGHGAVEVGRRLQSLGAAYFGVATIDEGKELRENGMSAPILVLSGVMPWEPLEALSDYDLTVAVGNFDLLERIGRFGGARPLKVHVKIDTGMGRLGFGTAEMPRLFRSLEGMRNAQVEGVMSHFPSSERRDEYGLRQVALFGEAIEGLKSRGIAPRFSHMANSAAICNYPEAHFDMVRPGIMLYGCYPKKTLCEAVRLEPVMTWRSSVSFVRTFPAGTALSYGGSYVTGGETRIAYVPVGYADGYPRSLSNRGVVLVAGRRCPVVGAVCMDWIFVDVTGVPEGRPGAEVVLLGRAGQEVVTADEVAEKAGTIPYEVLCGVSKHIERRYVSR